MRLLQFAIVLSVAVGGVAAPALALGVELPQVRGFHIGSQQRAGSAVLVELVPVGQTVERYDKMITLMTAPGAGRIPGPAYIAQFAKRYMSGCPGSTAAPVTMGTEAGIRIDCSRHPNTGRPETVFARALVVGPDMAMVQYMTTYMTMPTEAQWARNYLGSVKPR